MRPLGKIFTLAAAAVCFVAAAARAQDAYPARLVTLIVPFAAGGPTDVVARLVAEHMSKTLGQQIVIENVIGAGGTTSAVRAMRSPPDGYTIMMGHMGTHAAAVAHYPNLPYDPATDFEPIGMVAGMPVLMLVKKDAPARDLAAFVELARRETGKLKMAHAGNGSISYTTCQLFNSLIGAKPALVAFQGTAPAMSALVAGRVDYMCDQSVSVVPEAQAGRVRVLVVGTQQRNPVLPDVPTAREAGLPEFQASAWNALFAPKHTPRPVIASLNAALGRALDDPYVRSRLLALGSEIPDAADRTPDALAKLVQREIAKWTAVKSSNSLELRGGEREKP